MRNMPVIAVDLAKSVFEVAVSVTPGVVSERQRLSRSAFARFFATRDKSIVVMEACGSAHYWGRRLQQLGHEVKLLPAHLVRPYVPRNKTDRADAKGILEAFRNADIKPVPVKTESQQMLAALHRMRSLWIGQRTATTNCIRGLLREQGILIANGASKVVPVVRGLVGDADSGLPLPTRHLLSLACEHVRELDARIDSVDQQLAALVDQTLAARQLLSVPGVGVISATAILAFVGDVSRFPSARHFASFLGLTPRETSSGGRRRLGRISKRGDVYLRTLLIHGARAALAGAKRTRQPDRLRRWALDVEQRVRHNRATVALANKIARIAWAVLRHADSYRSTPVPDRDTQAAA